MFYIQALLPAEGITRDIESNNSTLFNVLQTISTTSFPLQFSPLYVYLSTRRDEGDPSEVEAKVSIYNNNNLITESKIGLDFLNLRNHNSKLRINGLLIDAPGDLKIKCEVSETTMEYTIDIVLLEKAETEIVIE